MPTLHVRNVPESLYERLQLRASEQNRSLSAEVLVLLDRALDERLDEQAKLLAGIRRRRFFEPGTVNAPTAVEMLREDRER